MSRETGQVFFFLILLQASETEWYLARFNAGSSVCDQVSSGDIAVTLTYSANLRKKDDFLEFAVSKHLFSAHSYLKMSFSSVRTNLCNATCLHIRTSLCDVEGSLWSEGSHGPNWSIVHRKHFYQHSRDWVTSFPRKQFRLISKHSYSVGTSRKLSLRFVLSVSLSLNVLCFFHTVMSTNYHNLLSALDWRRGCLPDATKSSITSPENWSVWEQFWIPELLNIEGVHRLYW